MKRIFTIRNLMAFLILVIISGSSGCASAKDAQERRNLMIPKKDELPRNKKYISASKRKTTKIKTSKAKKNKRYY